MSYTNGGGGIEINEVGRERGRRTSCRRGMERKGRAMNKEWEEGMFVRKGTEKRLI